MGFCVASTKNGSASACRTRPTVTCRSCIASNSAACVFGGVRLISSARITLANSGPSRKRNSRDPVRAVLLDHVGAGDVGGHEVGRELDAAELRFSARLRVLIISVLASPGTPSNRQCPRLNRRDQQLLDHVALADDDLGQAGR